ncbi:hypothetical protein [uncultured Robinsoniella sp.]|uniref:hypothetical protein n=1 Tax=Robinsoniella sp. TaxID=2496533 RepID=UPI00374F1793
MKMCLTIIDCEPRVSPSCATVPQTRQRYAGGISLEQKRSILSIEAVPQTRLRYAGG